MTNEYFLQKTDSKWEEVDKYIFDNYKFAEAEDGKRRYGENRFSIVDGQVNLSMSSISKQDIGIIARICGCTTIPAHNAPGGFAPKPSENVRVHKGNSTFYHNVTTGEEYIKRPKKAA